MVLALSPSLQGKHLHEFAILVDLSGSTTDLLIGMLQEKEIGRIVDISVATWYKISVMINSSFDFLRYKRRIFTFDRTSWHNERIEVSHNETVIGYNSLQVLEKLQGDGGCKQIVLECFFRLLTRCKRPKHVDHSLDITFAVQTLLGNYRVKLRHALSKAKEKRDKGVRMLR